MRSARYGDFTATVSFSRDMASSSGPLVSATSIECLLERLSVTKRCSTFSLLERHTFTLMPYFFSNAETSAPMMASLTSTTGFEVRSMLTVPLKTNIVVGAVQVLNKELSAGTGGAFTEKDLTLLQEVA